MSYNESGSKGLGITKRLVSSNTGDTENLSLREKVSRLLRSEDREVSQKEAARQQLAKMLLRNGNIEAYEKNFGRDSSMIRPYSTVPESQRLKSMHKTNPDSDTATRTENANRNFTRAQNSNARSSLMAEEFSGARSERRKTLMEVQRGAKKTSASNNTISDNTNGSSIVDYAKKYLGTPYVWGGESMDEGGMDCSGFVYRALKDAGYNVGRTTAQGYRAYGTAVSKSEMQPGDLIFFGSANNASHIGIYIGNGQMIHSSGGSKNTASNPGKGVEIKNVDYRSDFVEARRY